jgi:hypothetical protein
MTLLSFLFDCLRQEFSDCFDDESMDQIKLQSTVAKVVKSLLDTCDQDPGQIHKKIKFLCSFLEQLEFEDVLLDTPDKLSSSADLFKQGLTAVIEQDEDENCPFIQGIQIDLDYFSK